MNCLELFKGNSYFGNYIKCDIRNHLITQDENTPSTFQSDIKTFNREIVLKNKYPQNYFDIIIAYPPHSAKQSEIETMFEIIEYYKRNEPNLKYIILRTPSLHKYILKHKKEYYNHKTFDVCKYGCDHYREVIFFTNINIQPKRCMDTCENLITNKYLNYKEHVSKPPARLIIPPQLIYQILEQL